MTNATRIRKAKFELGFEPFLIDIVSSTSCARQPFAVLYNKFLTFTSVRGPHPCARTHLCHSPPQLPTSTAASTPLSLLCCLLFRNEIRSRLLHVYKCARHAQLSTSNTTSINTMTGAALAMHAAYHRLFQSLLTNIHPPTALLSSTSTTLVTQNPASVSHVNYTSAFLHDLFVSLSHVRLTRTHLR